MSHGDRCWEWPGYVDRAGYGRHGKHGYMHRTILELKLGRDLVDGEVAMHICDNRRCINPDHLTAGTHADNTRDMLIKGRQENGERTLTRELVRSIKSALEAGERGRRIAERLGLHESTVSKIKKGDHWSCI